MALTDGLVGRYELEDNLANGTVVNDVGINGIIIGGANSEDLSTTGKIGLGLNLDGANDLIVLGNLGILNEGMTQDFTILFWMRVDSAPADLDTIFSGESNTATNNGFQVEYDTGTSVWVLKSEKSGTANGINFPSSVATTVIWQHMGFIWDATGGSWSTYYNGNVESDASFPGGIVSGTSNAMVMGSRVTAARPTDATVDGVYIFDEIKSAADIKEIYNLGNAGKTISGALVITDNIVTRYDLDETTGTSATDLGTEGNNGTLEGTTFDVVTIVGQVGNAPDLDGVNDDVRATSPFVFNVGMTHDFTASMWARDDGTPSNDHLFSVFINDDNLVKIRAVNSSPDFIDCSIRLAGVNMGVRADHETGDNLWFNLTLTWNATDQTFKAYVNNVDVTGVASSSIETGATPNEIAIGCKSGGLGCWEGPLDNFLIWSRLLDSSDRTEQYDLGNAGQPIDGTLPVSGDGEILPALVPILSPRLVPRVYS